jgi:hypothetical protein
MAATGVPSISTLVHIANKGDVQFHGSSYSGTKGEGKALEGFAVSCSYALHINTITTTTSINCIRPLLGLPHY